MSVKMGSLLLVEDNADDVLLLRRAFMKVNVCNPLQIVSDAESAIAYLSGQEPYADPAVNPRPVLMLLDLKLPGKSGHDVLAWVRQQPALRRLPVVVLTSSREACDVNRAYELGVNSYLVKPATLDGLMDLTRNLVRYWLELNELPEVATTPVCRGES